MDLVEWDGMGLLGDFFTCFSSEGTISSSLFSLFAAVSLFHTKRKTTKQPKTQFMKCIPAFARNCDRCWRLWIVYRPILVWHSTYIVYDTEIQEVYTISLIKLSIHHEQEGKFKKSVVVISSRCYVELIWKMHAFNGELSFRSIFLSIILTK